jgi:hypothetical protein
MACHPGRDSIDLSIGIRYDHIVLGNVVSTTGRLEEPTRELGGNIVANADFILTVHVGPMAGPNYIWAGFAKPNYVPGDNVDA